ncbi:MAG: peptidylprolyl isomerase, partial [Candidatus Obscuribacterales bacterium]|nr:peptidylprolyl isomerase [Candidatus Obscuribacterales bacterium]
MNAHSIFKSLSLTVATLTLLSGCSQKAVSDKNEKDTSSKNVESSSKNERPEETGNTIDTSAKSSVGGEIPSSFAENKGSTESAEQNKSASSSQPQGKVNINLNELPDDVPICSVSGTDIKVGDYKRMLRIQQSQANQALIVDPQAKARLLAEAKRLNLSLTDEEKSKLLAAARQQKGQDPKEFQAFLKQSKSTEEQFDNEILQSGLAFKMSNAIIEQSLLPDLVNRELLAQAAKEAGAEKTAQSNYLKFKDSPAYKQLSQQTGLSEAALKGEMLKAEMAKYQLSKLEAQSTVTDAEVKKLYDRHKSELKHGERIRLSTILIAAPENNIGPISSVRNQVLKANPKLSGTELDNTVSQILKQAEQKALILLGQAKGGADFAKLANDNSDDPQTKLKKSGGDMGYIEKKDIIPALGEAVFKLKAGEVLGQIVKSELGYNIYKVTGKEGSGTFKYEEVKPKLEILAKQSNLHTTLGNWLNERRKVTR